MDLSPEMVIALATLVGVAVNAFIALRQQSATLRMQAAMRPLAATVAQTQAAMAPLAANVALIEKQGNSIQELARGLMQEKGRAEEAAAALKGETTVGTSLNPQSGG